MKITPIDYQFYVKLIDLELDEDKVSKADFGPGTTRTIIKEESIQVNSNTDPVCINQMNFE